MLNANPVRVRYLEGTERGFLVLRSRDGKTLASGDLVQVLRGNRVTAHLVFRFKDGSLDDETAVFTQRNYFHLLTDHHIQKGPAYPNDSDVTIDVPARQVTVRFWEHGKEKVATKHLDLPADLANGMILNVLKNLDAHTVQSSISYVATTPQPQLVRLVIKPEGQEPFSVAGVRYEAMRYSARIELGGIQGLLAPLIGKEPPLIHIWVAGGQAPAFVKSQGPLCLGGAVWTIEMTSATFSGDGG